MSDALLAIAITDIRPTCAGVAGLEERFCKACERARTFWLSTDDMLRLKAALAATLLETSDEAEKERLEISSRSFFALNAALGAAQHGVDVDLESTLAIIPDGFETLPIMKIWLESET